MLSTLTWTGQIKTGERSTELGDEVLMTRIARRDSEALRDLYDRYSHTAFGLAYRILGDRPTAEEIVQEAFWRVWKRAKSYARNRGQVSTWVMSIVHHLAIDEVRRRQSRPVNASTDSEDETLMDLPDLRTDVAVTVVSNLTREQVRAAVARLAQPQREVLELAYFGGMTHQEISKHLGQPLGTVHTRTRTALAKLRQQLAAQAIG